LKAMEHVSKLALIEVIHLMAIRLIPICSRRTTTRWDPSCEGLAVDVYSEVGGRETLPKVLVPFLSFASLYV
jgi:hypothetical protein